MKETVPTDHTRARVVPPQAVAEQFSTLAGMVSARSQIVWGEHCSECDYPACYASCAFYTPRGDFHCRRFARGIEPLQAQPSQTRLHCIRFRKWGKLEGRGPAPILPAQVIPGFAEALQKMQKGGRYSVRIPAALAYGPAGTPDGKIPPNSDVLFDIHIVQVVPNAALMAGSGAPQGR